MVSNQPTFINKQSANNWSGHTTLFYLMEVADNYIYIQILGNKIFGNNLRIWEYFDAVANSWCSSKYIVDAGGGQETRYW